MNNIPLRAFIFFTSPPTFSSHFTNYPDRTSSGSSVCIDFSQPPTSVIIKLYARLYRNPRAHYDECALVLIMLLLVGCLRLCFLPRVGSHLVREGMLSVIPLYLGFCSFPQALLWLLLWRQAFPVLNLYVACIRILQFNFCFLVHTSLQPPFVIRCMLTAGPARNSRSSHVRNSPAWKLLISYLMNLLRTNHKSSRKLRITFQLWSAPSTNRYKILPAVW